MYDSGKIIPGLIIFVVLFTLPFLLNMGRAGSVPNPEKPVGVTQCVAPTDYMRSSHMVLLDQWRDQVLREGKRGKINVGGIEYEKSLMNGCMLCHTSKTKFCDECHKYASVNPYCWDCHIQPKEAL